MCSCNKKNQNNTARNRTPLRSNPIVKKGIVAAQNANLGIDSEQRKKQALRRDMIRRAKGV